MKAYPSDKPLQCPSAQPHMKDSAILGVVSGTVEEPRLAYLTRLEPVTDDLLALSQPVAPTEVFRFTATCAEKACQHFDGLQCRLALGIVQSLPTVVDTLPPCQLRPDCRWWQQEGKAACMRCPQVVTQSHNPSDALQQAATPHQLT